MRVIVYVEGTSDRDAMSALLAPLLHEKRKTGISIDFFETPAGDRKLSLVTKVPIRAANILLNDPCAHVVALPDLHPKNRGLPHETPDELTIGLRQRVEDVLRRKDAKSPELLLKRFHAFCFKHDLEALLLAAEVELANYLGLKRIERIWRVPVEDQNDKEAPKRVVEALFRRHGRAYRPTVDAPRILRAADYQELGRLCPEGFGQFLRFVTELEIKTTGANASTKRVPRM